MSAPEREVRACSRTLPHFKHLTIWGRVAYQCPGIELASPSDTPMSEQQLAKIRAEHSAYVAGHAQIGFDCCSAHDSANRVPALLAEVRRLRAALAAEKTWYRYRARGERRERERATTLSAKARTLRGRVGLLFDEVELLAYRLDRLVRACVSYRARVAELEQQLAAAVRRDITSPLRTILRHGDMSDQVRREIADLLADAEAGDPR